MQDNIIILGSELMITILRREQTHFWYLLWSELYFSYYRFFQI